MDKLKILIKNFSLSWTACMVAMTQGDLSVISMKHVMSASETGILTGLAMVAASLLPWKNQWLGIFLVGLFTMIADSMSHMSMFPYESAVTGLGAMLLAVAYEKIFKREISV